jgi:hypothetical protein
MTPATRDPLGTPGVRVSEAGTARRLVERPAFHLTDERRNFGPVCTKASGLRPNLAPYFFDSLAQRSNQHGRKG